MVKPAQSVTSHLVETLAHLGNVEAESNQK
jgi:hypothetical protein